MRNLDAVIKAYDVRGIYPDQLDEDLAHAVGAAFVRVLGIAAAEGGPGAVVIAHDMRPSGPSLVASFAQGVREQGCDVILVGLASTDGLYFASGHLGLPGAMFTASHNPARYNGIKLCRPGAAPVGQDSGLRAIRELVESGGVPAGDGPPGQAREQDMTAEYAAYLRGLVDLSGSRPLRVVVDAGNGMGGFTVPAVLGTEAGLPALPLDVDPMYFELDGSFPNHEANPIDPENLRDLQARVRETGADIGLAFDGDADRCFVVDERGEIVSPSTLTALIAARELAKAPGSAVIHNLITSRAVPEVILENGGTPVRTRVGHSFIKATMAQTDAVFGGEHSGHFYFRDFWRADSGMLAALHVLAALGEAAPGTTLSSLLAPYDRYVASGEINTEVADQAGATAAVRSAYSGRDGFGIDELDGLTVSSADYWFNVRPSNTEPLLRLNVEAGDVETMAAVRDRVLAMMRGGGADG
ncbi:MAG: phosphomannomutase/phosphoglucomutase [Candidatus Nanopelagicales bacterium]